MEVGPSGAASPAPASSTLVAAPLVTEDKREIGNAAACAEVVTKVVERLSTPGGLAAFGNLKALEAALAAKDKTHVLGQQLLAVAQKAKKDAAKDKSRFTFDQNEAFPLASARQQIVRAFPSPDDATRQNLRKVATVIVTAVMGGAASNLCNTLDKSYCVKGHQLLQPLGINNEWRSIICAAVLAVAFAIQNHVAAPDTDRAAKLHEVLALLCRCGRKQKSVLPTALLAAQLSSALEALERRGALTKEVSGTPGEWFKPLLAEAFNMRTPDEISDERFEAAAWVQALAVALSLLDALEHGAKRFKRKELQAVVDALGEYQRGKSDHIICKIIDAKPYTVVEPLRVLDVLRDLGGEGRDVAAARLELARLEAGVAWVAVYVGDDNKVRIGVEIKYHGAFVQNHRVDPHAIDATSPRLPNALESLVDLRAGPDSYRAADPDHGHPFV